MTASMRCAVRDERIIELTRDGWKAHEIAVELGITARTVQRARARAGIARPAGRPMTADDLRIAAALLNDGASFGEVGRTLGRDLMTIRKYFPGRGWPRGSGIEQRRMMAALDAIPNNIVSLRKSYRDPGAVSVVDQPLRRMYAAFHAIPEVVS